MSVFFNKKNPKDWKKVFNVIKNLKDEKKIQKKKNERLQTSKKSRPKH